MKFIAPFLILFLCFKSFGQKDPEVIVQISRIDFPSSFKEDGKMKNEKTGRQFLLLNSPDSVLYRKSSKKDFIPIQISDTYLFDSCDYQTLEYVCKTIVNDSLENLCTYHNEKGGYYRIELFHNLYGVKLLTRSFVVNKPYKCVDPEVEKLVERTLEAIRKMTENAPN